MKVSQTILATKKESPKEAKLDSHKLCIRAGLIQKTASGIYSWLPMGLKVVRKIEAIVRSEMNKINSNEILLPSILPSELLKETHRWEKFGSELLKMKDRNDRDFCYGPTHEEAIVDIARKEIKSYKQLPLNFFQIQTKFRDEIRPKSGLMRCREFIMKDAYSFHNDENCLNETYNEMYKSYENILNRIGLKYKIVEADSGAIGGKITHEFQVLADSGEDIICYSSIDNYAANIEAAKSKIPNFDNIKPPSMEMNKFATPDVFTINDICEKNNIEATKTVKTIIVKDEENNYYALVLRGDHNLNEIKASKLDFIAGEITFAEDNEVKTQMGATVGSLGPVNCLIKLVVDYEAAMLSDFTAGANESGYHYEGINWQRDVGSFEIADIRDVCEGDEIPDGEGVYKLTKGIEVGHIFQLGTVYSESMKADILNKNGKTAPLFMGCYGFGVTRAVAATIEQSHDERGIIWPASIAPYDIVIIPINMHKSDLVKSASYDIYNHLKDEGYDVLIDDRKERPGIMFADADLIGIPNQVIIGEKSLKDGAVEYKNRATNEKEIIDIKDILDHIKNKYK